MVAPGKGLFYAPSPAPQSGDAAMVAWCVREFGRIADVLREGGSQSLRLDVQRAKPERPIEGMIMYFAEDVVTAGSDEGCYEYSGGAWVKL
jgi:hypothetical protein